MREVQGDGVAVAAAMPGEIASRAEWLVDMVLHALALAAIAVGLPFLFSYGLGAGGVAVTASLVAYSIGLLASFTCSALYNGDRLRRRKALLQRLDHSAIFLLIAGTYTPFALLKLNHDGTGIALLATVWGLAGLGIALKLLAPERGRPFAILLYLGMGWSMLFALGPLLDAVSGGVAALLFIGGGAYSLGVVFHLLTRLRFSNEIWHCFVIAGAACHYAAVFNAVAA